MAQLWFRFGKTVCGSNVCLKKNNVKLFSSKLTRCCASSSIPPQRSALHSASSTTLLPSLLRSLHTSTHPLHAERRNRGPHGFRSVQDHRGPINPGNRPVGENQAKDSDDGDDILDDADYSTMLHNAEGLSAGVVSKTGLAGGVFVVLPWVKWGPKRKDATTQHLLLEEACALANSLSEVTIIDQESVSVVSKQRMFGFGQLMKLTDKISTMSGLSAVFISVDFLSLSKVRELESMFNMRVVDRYWVVLAIFHQHARTLEARMQVALAEMPYIKSRTRQDGDRDMLDTRIRRLKKQLGKLSQRRQYARQRRATHGMPTVAVVGYTNTGKTSIIRSLSGDDSVQGKDQLFATLDVTAHSARLPCGINAVLIDTVGFIQDIPIGLVASFTATLQDAANADVILHVRDLSHPDRLMHHTTVMAALHSIKLLPTTPIITLDNKVDLLAEGDAVPPVLGGRDHGVNATPQHQQSAETCSYLGHSSAAKGFDMKAVADAEFMVEDELEEDEVDEVAEILSHEEEVQAELTQRQQLEKLKEEFNCVPCFPVSAKTNQGLMTIMKVLEDHILRVTERRMYRMRLPTGGEHIRILRSITGLAEENIVADMPDKSEVLCVMNAKELASFKKSCRKLVAEKT